jgi:hypothetical protein
VMSLAQTWDARSRIGDFQKRGSNRLLARIRDPRHGRVVPKEKVLPAAKERDAAGAAALADRCIRGGGGSSH